MSSPASPPDPQVAANEDLRRSAFAFGIVVAKITPWLLDLGSWIFGALVAFNLLILGSLLTVGPVDVSVIVSTAALAISLPLAAAGFFLLRLAQDMKKVGLEEVATQAFQEVGYEIEAAGSAPVAPEVSEKRRTAYILAYCYGLLALSAFLTLLSVTAALWHMGWWIGLLFVVVAVVALVAVFGALASTGSRVRWRSPSGVEEPKNESKAPDRKA